MSHKSNNTWRLLTVRQLRGRRARLVRQLPDLQATLHGALQHQMRQCGEPGCRCAAGERHGPYRYLAVRIGSRRRLLYVPAGAGRSDPIASWPPTSPRPPSQRGLADRESNRLRQEVQFEATVGTAAYMSPEQARGKAVDKRSDVWAFGCEARGRPSVGTWRRVAVGTAALGLIAAATAAAVWTIMRRQAIGFRPER